MSDKICIVGAGLSGAVVAQGLARQGHDILLIDERDHIAGNCHCERDTKTNIMVHRYGPHIFHTNDKTVWDYVEDHCTMMTYVNRVKTTIKEQVFSMPINLHTINQFFKVALNPTEAQAFIAQQANSAIKEPRNFEEQALKMIGNDLYQAFFYGYTKKQWGLEPRELPAAILKRLPVRFTYDDNYFFHRYQGIPKEGYTKLVEKIIGHDKIQLRLKCRFEDVQSDFKHVFYTGPLDRYYNYKLGDLNYRTLDFKMLTSETDIQGCAVMNYGNEDVPYTRITEHKYFAPWDSEKTIGSVAFQEFSRASERHDIPYYPIRLAHEKKLLQLYIEHAKKEKNVSFLGRLGTYSYLDMDVAIKQAFETVDAASDLLRRGDALPAFFHQP